MRLNDHIDCVGKFVIKTYKEDGSVEIYEEKNLIMDEARKNMAHLLGGVDSGSTYGEPINKFIIGTLGHNDDDILDPIEVGTNDFDSTRTALFSQEDASAYNYVITFDPAGTDDISVDGTGVMYQGTTAGDTDATANTVERVVSDRTVTYTITIPSTNGNHPVDDVIAYTEAALYAGDIIFSMKTFNGRVKEDTVKIIIEWSIIF